MAGHGEGPEGVAAVLHRIAVQHDGRLRADAEAAEQFGHRRRRNEFAVGLVPAGRFPEQPQGARNVPLVIGLVVAHIADLEDAQIGIGEMILEPGGGDER